MTLTTRIAEWINQAELENVPALVIEKAEKSILDTFGTALAGSASAIGVTIRDHLTDLGGSPQGRVWGTDLKTSVPLAALANSTMGHVLDFDDTSMRYIGHASVCVLPAAVAMGEKVAATGADVLLAYIIGTEVACKLGTIFTPKMYTDGWHSTSVIGAFGAAAAAARLLALNPNQTAKALGLVSAQTSGLKGSFGFAAKPYQVGRAAENGVVAALLAQRGLDAAKDVFERPYGFCHTFKLGLESAALLEDLGNPFDIDQPGFFLKEFPSCSATQAAVNAAIAMSRTHEIDPEAIDKVDCSATTLVIDSLPYAQPQDVSQARFSMPFCLARALLNRGRLDLTDFTPQWINDLKTQSLIKKIRLRVSEQWAQMGYAPAEEPEAAVVEIVLKDGRSYRKRKTKADWRPDQMPSWETLGHKFRSCGEIIKPRPDLERIIDQVRHLDRLADIRELTALLAHL